MLESFIIPTVPKTFNIKHYHAKSLMQDQVRMERVVLRDQYKPQLLKEIPNQSKTHDKIAVRITWGTKIIWVSKKRVDVFGL